MQDEAIDKLVLEIIEENQPIKAIGIVRILREKMNKNITKQDINSLLYGRLAYSVNRDDEYQWTLQLSREHIQVESSTEIQAEQNSVFSNQSPIAQKFLINRTSEDKYAAGRKKSSTLSLANLTDYYLESLAQERDSEIQLYANPFNEDGPNFLVLNGLPIYDDNSGIWPERTRQFIARRPRSANVNLYIGYPVFVQKNRPGSSDKVYPLFLFNLQTEKADSSGFPTLDLDPPRINAQAFKRTSDSFSDMQDDLKRMRSTLGLDVDDQEELPTHIELIDRLKKHYPTWPWQEALNVYQLSTSDLSNKEEGGFYNSAILFWGEGSKFVQGLESELRELSRLTPDQYAKSSLTQILEISTKKIENSVPKSIHRHLPLNPSQIDAVKSAMTNPLTVITGPPGTGKSQVVGSIITNAALNGQSVLVSSKNHKAVDVVTNRVNSLATHPFLNKLGNDANTADIIQLVNMISTNQQVNLSDFEFLKKQTSALQQDLATQHQQLEDVIKLRNRIDEISRLLPDDFSKYGPHFIFSSTADRATKHEHFSKTCAVIERDFKKLQEIKSSIRYEDLNLMGKCLWLINKKSRMQTAASYIRETSGWYGLTIKINDNDINEIIAACDMLIKKVTEALELSKILEEYFRGIQLLNSFDISKNQEKYQTIEEKLSTIDLEYWQEWIKLLPSRMSRDHIQLLSQYSTLLRLANTGDDADNRRVSAELKRLTPKVTPILPAWAITSLSLKNRIPFDDGLFDLVVIDEASQCDIASALPLLFRAKRAVIIGDPQQLKHITGLLKAADTRLMIKHGILENPTWGYSANSLFDAMASLPIAQRFTLNEHHRSDNAIIDFSNKHFYDGNLIIATRHKKLKRSENSKSIEWINICGEVKAPSGSGAMNMQEVEAVHRYLKELLIERGYKGTVGVVTPFRYQANRIREMVEGDIKLQEYCERANVIIDTVHKFQGDERDVMIFSPVLSKGIRVNALGFLKSQGNLFNVAITRARSHLVIIGDKEYCRNSEVKYMAAFVNYYEDLEKSKSRQISDHENLPAKHPLKDDPKVSIWETKLYEELRSAGLLPIPQYSEDKYALDFAIFRQDGAKLNIEVDGEMYHKSWTGQRLRSDIIRNQTLIELGWQVKRFWVYQLKEDMQKCVSDIVKWTKETKK